MVSKPKSCQLPIPSKMLRPCPPLPSHHEPYLKPSPQLEPPPNAPSIALHATPPKQLEDDQVFGLLHRTQSKRRPLPPRSRASSRSSQNTESIKDGFMRNRSFHFDGVEYADVYKICDINARLPINERKISNNASIASTASNTPLQSYNNSPRNRTSPISSNSLNEWHSPSSINRSLIRSNSIQHTAQNAFILSLQQQITILKSHIQSQNEERKMKEISQNHIIQELQFEVQKLRSELEDKESSSESDDERSESEASENEGSITRQYQNGLRMHLDEQRIETLIKKSFESSAEESNVSASEDETVRRIFGRHKSIVSKKEFATQTSSEELRIKIVEYGKMVDSETLTDGQLLTHKETQTKRISNEYGTQTEFSTNETSCQTDPILECASSSHSSPNDEAFAGVIAGLRDVVREKVKHTEMLRLQLLETEKQSWLLHSRLSKVQEQHAQLVSHVSSEYPEDTIVEHLKLKLPKHSNSPDHTKRISDLLNQIANQEKELANFENNQLDLNSALDEKNIQISMLDESLFKCESELKKQQELVERKDKEFLELKAKLDEFTRLYEEQIQLHKETASSPQIEGEKHNSSTNTSSVKQSPIKSHCFQSPLAQSRLPVKPARPPRSPLLNGFLITTKVPHEGESVETALKEYLSSPNKKMPNGCVHPLHFLSKQHERHPSGSFENFSGSVYEQNLEIKVANWDREPVGHLNNTMMLDSSPNSSCVANEHKILSLRDSNQFPVSANDFKSADLVHLLAIHPIQALNGRTAKNSSSTRLQSSSISKSVIEEYLSSPELKISDETTTFNSTNIPHSSRKCSDELDAEYAFDLTHATQSVNPAELSK